MLEKVKNWKPGTGGFMRKLRKAKYDLDEEAYVLVRPGNVRQGAADLAGNCRACSLIYSRCPQISSDVQAFEFTDVTGHS